MTATSPLGPRSSSAPFVSFGREVCGDLPSALRREWLVTNGLGGFASGTVAGVATRRYHGLLVAALRPPVERTVLVAAVDERARYAGRESGLSTHEFGGGVLSPRGFRLIASFVLDGVLPVWTFALADALVEKRVWIDHGTNTTRLTYRIARATAPVELTVTPLVTCRDFHSLSAWPDWRPEHAVAVGRGVTLAHPAVTLRLLSEGGAWTPAGDWWWDFHHREEAARGLDARSDLYAPARVTATLAPGATLALTFTVEPVSQPAPRNATAVGTDAPGHPMASLTAEPTGLIPAAQSLARDRHRQSALLAQAAVTTAHPALQQLILAADQFLVRRDSPLPTPTPERETSTLVSSATPSPVLPHPSSLTVIAGYPWFNDWGRDTMIALPGLTLATGRAAEGAAILRAFAPYVRDGLLPNNFPDRADTDPGYNTADATLWYVLAVEAHTRATGDGSLVDELLPVFREIVWRHIAGARHGIGVDPADGLLRAGEPGVQLTWMDAKVGDWVVTPRRGKPVEINALWYNALRIVAGWLRERGDGEGMRLDALADQARASFRARFVVPGSPFLADVVDGPDGDDLAVRPNQIFAVSLPFPLVEGGQARALVDAVGRDLLASHGLRSLSPADPAYRGVYAGGPLERDGGYHQGPVWTWLIGPYVAAHYRVYGDRETALSYLRPFLDHLRDAGLGSVSELLDGDPPHHPRGCIAQAWGVAEVLRLWRLLASRQV